MNNVINIQDAHKPRKGMGYEPPPTKGNWLEDMVQGTRFLAKRKFDGGSKLTEFVVATDPKTIETVLLGESCNGMGSFAWHDPDIFCQDHKFYLVLEVMDKKDDNNLLPRPMASDEDVKEGDSRPDIVD